MITKAKRQSHIKNGKQQPLKKVIPQNVSALAKQHKIRHQA